MAAGRACLPGLFLGELMFVPKLSRLRVGLKSSLHASKPGPKGMETGQGGIARQKADGLSGTEGDGDMGWVAALHDGRFGFGREWRGGVRLGPLGQSGRCRYFFFQGSQALLDLANNAVQIRQTRFVAGCLQREDGAAPARR